MNLSELQLLIAQPNVQAQIKAEIGAAEINRQMLSLYLQHLDADDCDFEDFRNLIRLVVGFSYEEKFKILERARADADTLADIKRNIENFEADLQASNYQNCSSMISKSALLAININQASVKQDPTFVDFLKKLIVFTQHLTTNKSLQPDAARKLYVDTFEHSGFPSHINSKTLCAVLYAAKPDTFPLVNDYVLGQLKKLIPKLDPKSPQSYIDTAAVLDGLLDAIGESRHFGVIDRIMAITSSEEITLDLTAGMSATISKQSAKSPEHNMPSKNQILYGAAGTGKTYHPVSKALEIIDPNHMKTSPDRQAIKQRFDELVEEKRIQFVTFHQSFSYEDFVEGIGVKLGHGDGTTAGRLDYEVKAGVFKQICEAAQQDNSQPYVLIIDEINRGNISRIFGELITLLEDSKREGEDEALSVTLPYSKEKFSVPSNLYIIGTMNSSDRSLTGLDIALRRRFSFIEMQPNPEVLKDIKVEGVEIEKLLEKMNQRIEVLLDRDHCIGHAYFMPLQQDGSIEKLAEIFAQKIIPLLQEYFYDDWERIAWVLNCNGMLKLKYDEKGLEKLFHKNAHGKLQNHNWDVDNTKLEDIEAYKVIIGSASGNAS